MTDRYIRRSEVARIVGLSTSTLWRMEAAGEFPARRQLGVRSVAWLESEVLAWMDARAEVPAGEVA